MICDPCKRRRHNECLNKTAADPNKPPTGLNDAANAIQLSGLCPCQHKVKLMSPITLEEAEEKIRAGLDQDCGCGGKIVAGPEEPEGEAGEFVRLWFEDHSHKDLSLHGLAVKAKTEKMRAAAR